MVTADSLSAGDVHVLLPKSFDVGVCEGHCTKLQLSPHTDHAHILSLYYHINVSEVTSKCCVPTSYKKINMIFYNKANDKGIMKQNVTCDCHLRIYINYKLISLVSIWICLIAV